MLADSNLKFGAYCCIDGVALGQPWLAGRRSLSLVLTISATFCLKAMREMFSIRNFIKSFSPSFP